MIPHEDNGQLASAHRTLAAELLAERCSTGSWTGELSSSPLATATAISALVLAEQSGTCSGLPSYTPGVEPSHIDEIYRGDLSQQLVRSLHWLAQQQNDDGGWGDTDRSQSNVATTMLVQAAFHLTGVPAKYHNLLEQAKQYIDVQGGIVGLKKRYAGDKTFAVPILANCALADLVPWRKVPALPFELTCLPWRWFHRLRMSVVSYALPALVAIGQAKFHHAPPRNPVVRLVRSAARKRSLAMLEAMQPASGGFLEATPLTSFVVMSLASMGLAEHNVVRRGVEFLLTSVRSDGSWPIDTNLATWNSSQAVVALDWNLSSEDHSDEQPSHEAEASLDWLLGCQHQQRDSLAGAGGWAWTDRSGGLPDSDDTSAALLALAAWRRKWPGERVAQIEAAAEAGIAWLINLQNQDGGWPTFCRGWGRLPFDRSCSDISAHALRALHAWRELLKYKPANSLPWGRVDLAIDRGLSYLSAEQQADGSWLPLWFGNQHHPQDANPVVGTAKVLMMCHELGQSTTEMAQRGERWLTEVQYASGGWGAVCDGVTRIDDSQFEESSTCSVEETALALAALATQRQPSKQNTESLRQGSRWLVAAVQQGRHLQPSPIGFYFAKLWYHERLYPLIFATQALAEVRNRAPAEPAPMSVAT